MTCNLQQCEHRLHTFKQYKSLFQHLARHPESASCQTMYVGSKIYSLTTEAKANEKSLSSVTCKLRILEFELKSKSNIISK